MASKQDPVKPAAVAAAPKEGFWSGKYWGYEKRAYRAIAEEFHAYHKHDMNVLLHLFTTSLGVWGAIQLGLILHLELVVFAYFYWNLRSVPNVPCVLHCLFVGACCLLSAAPMAESWGVSPTVFCLGAIAAGFGLQDLAHYLCQEDTYIGSYIVSDPFKLVLHTVWLMPLVIDSVLMRHCFLPYMVSRNRNIASTVASKQAVDTLKKWVKDNIPNTPETTHVWPHKHEGTSAACKALEDDAGILAAFRTVFSAKHFDIRPIQGMNEIYVTAVGAKKDINSDAVFYTPHWDGPYAWVPGASCYRVLVGITHNEMVRTRYNLQHESQDQVLDQYDVVGFDYNRELHWIDHVPGKTNKERRSVLKLHYVIYPRAWPMYGNLVAAWNTNYNTWARNNFLQTLRPKSAYDYVLAWWIWLTTFGNAVIEENFGWYNLAYMAVTYAMGPTAFLILTSFRHYVTYMTTFAFRQPMVAHGYLMRDCKFFKTVALMHLAPRTLPLVQLPRDIPGLLLAIAGFGVAILATMQLGYVRTYFGSELGFVKPKWIDGFPYNVIPHPMIVGQLFAYSSILAWWWNELTTETVALIATHMTFYTAHMIQEMLTSSY